MADEMVIFASRNTQNRPLLASEGFCEPLPYSPMDGRLTKGSTSNPSKIPPTDSAQRPSSRSPARLRGPTTNSKLLLAICGSGPKSHAFAVPGKPMESPDVTPTTMEFVVGHLSRAG